MGASHEGDKDGAEQALPLSTFCTILVPVLTPQAYLSPLEIIRWKTWVSSNSPKSLAISLEQVFHFLCLVDNFGTFKMFDLKEMSQLFV